MGRGGWNAKGICVRLAARASLARSSVTLVAEDLAAHGYVALVLDHPADAAAVDLPGEPSWF